jgi:hypothetical protein
VAPPKQAGVAILISHKIDFKLTLIKGDIEEHFILTKEEIYQKEITINLYAPNVSAPNFTKHTLKDLKADRLLVGDFNTPLSPIDTSSKKSTQKF